MHSFITNILPLLTPIVHCYHDSAQIQSKEGGGFHFPRQVSYPVECASLGHILKQLRIELGLDQLVAIFIDDLLDL